MKEIVQSVLHNTFENHDSPGTIEHELFTEIRNALIPEIRAKLLPEIRRIVHELFLLPTATLSTTSAMLGGCFTVTVNPFPCTFSSFFSAHKISFPVMW